MLVQQLLNGITLGGLYALIALGYTMVYGVLKMINFAHSEIFMVGAFLGLFFLNLLTPMLHSHVMLLLFSTFFLAMLGSGICGVLIEKLAYRPLRSSGRLTPLISAIGVSIFLQNFVMLAVSPQSLPMTNIFPVVHYQIGKISFSSFQLFVFAVSLLLMVIFHLFISKTRTGRAIRATSLDKDTAALMGVPVNRIISLVFFIGGALGGAAGVLVGLFYGSVKYNMGFTYGLKAFTAAVIGGIGNIPGAMFGGILLGVLESLGAGYVSSAYKDVIAFVILILVLLIKPAGIFGKTVDDKC